MRGRRVPPHPDTQRVQCAIVNGTTDDLRAAIRDALNQTCAALPVSVIPHTTDPAPGASPFERGHLIRYQDRQRKYRNRG